MEGEGQAGKSLELDAVAGVDGDLALPPWRKEQESAI